MQEQTIFSEALEKDDLQERAAFLDSACANDPVLRQRIEKLLERHKQGDSFLESPLADLACAGATQCELPADEGMVEELDFLVPSDKPGACGRLGHYDVLEVIGRGGMGIVLRAFDERLHRIVAIKVMAAELATNASARKRFKREAQAAAAVSHDHLVTIHAVEEALLPSPVGGEGSGVRGGLPYLVMQYVSGMSLQQRLDGSGPLELREIVRIGMQTAAGLAAAHAHGLIHRDIKPANILLENGVERVKITDFGLARAVADASVTQSGVVAGTPQYMSPEQARGEAVDQRTDLFSLGSVLYAMCTGRAPFRASGSMAVLKRVCEETPRPIRETNPDIPDWLVSVIDKLHAKDPAGRYQTAAEVAELLNQNLAHLQHPSIIPLPVTRLARPPTARRRRMAAPLALLCLIAIAIVITAALTHIFTPDETPIVKDSPEGKAPSSGTAAMAVPHPFIVLSGKGVAERKFETLAEAVQSASAGDTVEIRGNGPFVCQPINLARTALTIRAAERFRPVLQLPPRSSDDSPAFLTTDARLVLEGLELWGDHPSAFGMLHSRGPLYLANCRLISKSEGKRSSQLVLAHNAPFVELRNCEFLRHDSRVPAVRWNVPPMGRFSMENCCGIDGRAIRVSILNHDPKEISIHLAHNTWSTNGRSTLLLAQERPVTVPPVTADHRLIHWNTVANVIDTAHFVLAFEQPGEGVVPLDAEVSLARMVNWQEEKNVYSASGLLTWGVAFKHIGGLNDLAAWNRIWKLTGTGSVEGRPQFQGGNLRAKALAAPENVRPDDFRLRPDSPGYKAGKDGKDLGADVDLVGPGPAYERWKKTPEYQQWLKDTNQLTKAKAPTAEPKAFVLLGGKGVAERKFDTLAEAVQSASAGDTIEVRGNGPFVTTPINTDQALTIRAGAGFRPIIKADPDEQGSTLLQSNSYLVLEGLDLQWIDIKPIDPSKPGRDCRLVVSSGPKAQLHAANCRFLMNFHEGRFPIHCIGVWNTPLCHLRNCQLLVAGQGRLNPTFDFGGCPNATLMVDNCLTIGNAIMPKLTHAETTKVLLNHNTLLGYNFVILSLGNKIDPPGGEKESRPIQIVTSANIFAGQMRFNQSADFLEKEKFLNAADAERLLTQLVGWQDNRNLYSSPEDSDLLGLFVQTKLGQQTAFPPTVPITTLLAWKTFWGMKEFDSQRGLAKFEGGDLVAKAKSTPELIVPEDFRLRPDSPGYKAGKDGKDLGADVDLVGPGPAYERWKKTPEYQQWLKDSGQVKK